tara:strand:- start:3 stop:383 length:381 start_codon:yes stop_codon:yes gene_type:complete
MAFPNLVPTSRSFESGDYPVKTFKAQNGAEVRILYGSNRTNMKLSLTYSNITDDNAALFLNHFDLETSGTFSTFDIADNTRGGWTALEKHLGAVDAGNRWRYEQAPQQVQVRPGISTVTVNLIGVL